MSHIITCPASNTGINFGDGVLVLVCSFEGLDKFDQKDTINWYSTYGIKHQLWSCIESFSRLKSDEEITKEDVISFQEEFSEGNTEEDEELLKFLEEEMPTDENFRSQALDLHKRSIKELIIKDCYFSSYADYGLPEKVFTENIEDESIFYVFIHKWVIDFVLDNPISTTRLDIPFELFSGDLESKVKFLWHLLLQFTGLGVEIFHQELRGLQYLQKEEIKAQMRFTKNKLDFLKEQLKTIN